MDVKDYLSLLDEDDFDYSVKKKSVKRPKKFGADSQREKEIQKRQHRLSGPKYQEDWNETV